MKPLSQNHWLLFAALLGTGCDRYGALGEDVALTGVIKGWTDGTGYGLAATLLTIPETKPPLSMGTIDASGAFSIKLPTSEAVAPHLNDAPQPKGGFAICTSAPSFDPADLRIAFVVFSATKPGSPDIPIILSTTPPSRPPSPHDTAASYLYADRDGSITGTLSCGIGSEPNTEKYDLHLRKGWNTALWQINNYADDPTNIPIKSEVSTGAIPSEMNWRKPQ